MPQLKFTGVASQRTKKAMSANEEVYSRFMMLAEEFASQVAEKIERIQYHWDSDQEVGVSLNASGAGDIEVIVKTLASSQYREGQPYDLFALLDSGADPHVIMAQGNTPLVFQFEGRGVNYEPRTRPRILDSFEGHLPAKTVAMREVSHPGFAPREFGETIAKEVAGEFRRAVRSTMRRVVKIIYEKTQW